MPYPGCRQARCLCGGWPPLASSVALLGGLRGLSSPAHCTEAPGAGSWSPPSLLPVLLPLWGHRVTVSYILTQSEAQGSSLPCPGAPGRGPELRWLSTSTKCPMDQRGLLGNKRMGGARPVWLENTHPPPPLFPVDAGGVSSPPGPLCTCHSRGQLPRLHASPLPTALRGWQAETRDPRPNEPAKTKRDGTGCWHHAVPPGHLSSGTRQRPGTGLSRAKA